MRHTDMRNYELFDNILDLELSLKVQEDQTAYKKVWHKINQENLTKHHTLCNNRADIRDILKRLEPFSKITKGNVIYTVEAKELLTALRGLNL